MTDNFKPHFTETKFQDRQNFRPEKAESDRLHDVNPLGKGDINFKESRQEISETCEYFSTYEERLAQTPKTGERGAWTGMRGESKYILDDPEMDRLLAKYDLDGIEYEDGIPDFSDCADTTVEIPNMTENRRGNFEQCDQKCAEQWNQDNRAGRSDWNARDIADWRRENGYCWHERNDQKTCDLLPREINDQFGHLGGVSECRKRDCGKDDVFDD